MRFSETLDSMTREGETFRVNVADTWTQGRSVFGGMQSAVALRAMRALLPSDLPLRVLQTTFVAPVPPGDVRVRAQVLRTGKNVTHVEARLFDGNSTAAIVIGVFGSSRSSRVRVLPEQPKVDAPSPLELPLGRGLGPSFTQHFEVRWLTGGFPFTGSTGRTASIEIGLPDGAASVTAEHVLAIADMPPPIALSFLESPAPGSSVTWTMELLRDSLAGLSLRGWRLDVEIVAGQDGYTSQSVMVWGPGGEPVALSRQSMVIFG